MIICYYYIMVNNRKTRRETTKLKQQANLDKQITYKNNSEQWFEKKEDNFSNSQGTSHSLDDVLDDLNIKNGIQVDFQNKTISLMKYTKYNGNVVDVEMNYKLTENGGVNIKIGQTYNTDVRIKSLRNSIGSIVKQYKSSI